MSIPAYNIHPGAPSSQQPYMSMEQQYQQQQQQQQHQQQQYTNNNSHNDSNNHNNYYHDDSHQHSSSSHAPPPLTASSPPAPLPLDSPTSSSSSSSSSSSAAPSFPSSSSHSQLPLLPRFYKTLSLYYAHYLDQSVPQTGVRWGLLGVFCLFYCWRIYWLQGFYIVTYGLGIFLLNLLIGFLSPLDEDSMDGEGGGLDGAPILPLQDDPEFKPFIRRLPEFKFWHSCSKALVVAILLTYFPFFDVPVFWPILLIYFCILFVLTMKRQIKHMIKYKYIPFSFGKKQYNIGPGGNTTAAALLTAASQGVGNIINQTKAKLVAEDVRSR